MRPPEPLRYGSRVGSRSGEPPEAAQNRPDRTGENPEVAPFAVFLAEPSGQMCKAP
jgi:hypothetical protein